VVRGFEFAVGTMFGIRLVVRTAVGQRPAEALVEEQDEECDLDAFFCELVGIAAAIALQQAVPFGFP
jgi:hypothetical protein